MAVVKAEVLKLYKALLKEGGKFSSYNFRMYALRRIRSRFQENKTITDSTEIESCYKDGLVNLDILKRQIGRGPYRKMRSSDVVARVTQFNSLMTKQGKR